MSVACQYGFEEIALCLIGAGCDTTSQDDCGRNGLYHAVKRLVQGIRISKEEHTLVLDWSGL
jgi:hypothetical protein